MLDTTKETDLFLVIMEHCNDLAFEDIVGDEILIRDRADNNEALENLIFEYGLLYFVEEAFKVKHPELNNEVGGILKDAKKVVKYLDKELSKHIFRMYENDKHDVTGLRKTLNRAKRIRKYLKRHI